MILNIITPCSRPNNLHEISKSINIPKENYRWIVVFDLDYLENKSLIPNNCEYYFHKNTNSVYGHAQRNFAIDLIKEGYVYFNDDDTVIHQDLFENIKSLTEDFIHFSQSDKYGNIRLKGDNVNVGHIDSHNFIVSKQCIGDSKFIINKYEADGYFANECFQKANTKKFINKILSVYNHLR